MRIITHHLRQAVLLIWLRMIEHIVTTFFLITVSCVCHFTTVALIYFTAFIQQIEKSSYDFLLQVFD